MEDFEPLNLGWYQRSGRTDRQFFFYIETTSIIAGTATLEIPRSAINPRAAVVTDRHGDAWGRFADVTRISRAIRRNLIEGF